MGDFELSQPELRYRRAPSLTLGVGRLQLSPELAADIRALRHAPPTWRVLDWISRPNQNWHVVPNKLNASLAQPQPASGVACQTTLVPGPPLRQAKTRDILEAVLADQAVQQAWRQIMGTATRRFRHNSKCLSNISQAAVVTLASIAITVTSGGRPADALLSTSMGMIKDAQFRTPTYRGVKAILGPNSVKVSYGNPAAGLSLTFEGTRSDTGGIQGKAMLGFDLRKLFEAL
ncbi:MAG: hypothetical protein L3J24_09920 [Xanthomonadales bacterium]|nr:hypothetical protein [Xanthomonadales bacterium]